MSALRSGIRARVDGRDELPGLEAAVAAVVLARVARALLEHEDAPAGGGEPPRDSATPGPAPDDHGVVHGGRLQGAGRRGQGAGREL